MGITGIKEDEIPPQKSLQFQSCQHDNNLVDKEGHTPKNNSCTRTPPAPLLNHPLKLCQIPARINFFQIELFCMDHSNFELIYQHQQHKLPSTHGLVSFKVIKHEFTKRSSSSRSFINNNTVGLMMTRVVPVRF